MTLREQKRSPKYPHVRDIRIIQDYITTRRLGDRSTSTPPGNALARGSEDTVERALDVVHGASNSALRAADGFADPEFLCAPCALCGLPGRGQFPTPETSRGGETYNIDGGVESAGEASCISDGIFAQGGW